MMARSIQHESLDELRRLVAVEQDKVAAKSELEAADSLGSVDSIPPEGFELPSPTVGSLVLLDVLKSPFLTGADEVSLQQIMEALYVLCKREEAARRIYRAARARQILERLSDVAAKSPETFKIHCDSIGRTADELAAFDADVQAFADSIGQADPGEIVAAIREHIALSMGGFEMLPNDGSSRGEDQKKTL